MYGYIYNCKLLDLLIFILNIKLKYHCCNVMNLLVSFSTIILVPEQIYVLHFSVAAETHIHFIFASLLLVILVLIRSSLCALASHPVCIRTYRLRFFVKYLVCISNRVIRIIPRG